LKAVTFFDAGNAFASFPTAQEFNLLAAAGFGIRWFSPIGPLRFEWGFPINRRVDESDSVFQFFIGPPF
jgi:outer membrane protein insertion porin family